MSVLVIAGSISRTDIPELCERARELLAREDTSTILCDVGGLTDPDAAAIDVLARLQLMARRRGGEIRLVHAGAHLRELLDLAGLLDVVSHCGRPGFEAGRKVEQGEQTGGVQEETDPDDPIARQL